MRPWRRSIPFLPLEIKQEIINVLAQDDPSFSSTKACALVCREFHHLCRKHIFAFIGLNHIHVPSQTPNTRITIATTRMLQQLLDTTPEIADHICNLSYIVKSNELENDSLVETFRKITRLKSFTVCYFGSPMLQWNNNSLRPALLHLLHLPTLISFKMLFVENFLVSDLAPCINLKHLDFVFITVSDDETLALNPPQKSIRLHDVSAGLESATAIKRMCAMHFADGKPFMDFSCVNNLKIRLRRPDEVQAALHLLSCCEELTSVDVDVSAWDSLVNLTHVGFAKMLYPTMQTLKNLHVKISYDEDAGCDDPLIGLCNELQEMKNRNVVETITIAVTIQTDSDCRRGDEWGRLDAALAQPGWPKLQRVSLGIVVWSHERADDDLELALKELPQTQFLKLSSSKSLSFEFSVCGKRVNI